jgi:acylphosphatase
MKRVHVYISGHVQGVFFRKATSRVAADFNIAGWVRNTEDGQVEAVFEGDDAAIDNMIAWCKTGPPAAQVEQVSIREEPYTGVFSGFNINRF